MRRGIIALAIILLAVPGLAAGQAVPAPTTPPGELLALGPVGPPPLPPGPAGPPPPPPMGPRSGPPPGAWWKDSEIVRRLNISQAQVGRIEQIFLEHRLRLVDLRADLEKKELSLAPLLDAERPEEATVASQIDQITAARGRLEKEHALLLLAVRRELSVEQWKQLQTLQQERGGRGRPGNPPGGPESPFGRQPHRGPSR